MIATIITVQMIKLITRFISSSKNLFSINFIIALLPLKVKQYEKMTDTAVIARILLVFAPKNCANIAQSA